MAEVASLLAALKLNMEVDNQGDHVTKMKDGSLCQRLAICNLFNLFLITSMFDVTKHILCSPEFKKPFNSYYFGTGLNLSVSFQMNDRIRKT